MIPGTVFWLTGLSGAGKTTIGKLFYEKVRDHHANIVFLDGDILRNVFGNDLGHVREQRILSAMRNSRLCKMLSDQGIDVICSTISMFHEVRNWNRQNIKNYQEIYLRVPMDVLVLRDQKMLYSRALRGEIGDVMGIDIEFEEPESPDMVIDNDGDTNPDIISNIILLKYFPGLT